MLFHVIFEFTDQSEEGERRSLGMFAQWEPPEGADFIGFYGFADGTGGVAIIEVDTVATLARVCAVWTPWLSFTTTPIMPMEDAAMIGAEAVVYRDSV